MYTKRGFHRSPHAFRTRSAVHIRACIPPRVSFAHIYVPSPSAFTSGSVSAVRVDDVYAGADLGDARRERALFHSPTTGIRSHGGNANGTGQCRVQIDQVRSNPVHVVLHYKRASGDRFPLLSRLDLKRRRGYVTHVTYVRWRQTKQFGVFYGKRHTRRFGA